MTVVRRGVVSLRRVKHLGGPTALRLSTGQQICKGDHFLCGRRSKTGRFHRLKSEQLRAA